MKKFILIPYDKREILLNIDAIAYVNIADNQICMVDGSMFVVDELTSIDLLKELEIVKEMI